MAMMLFILGKMYKEYSYTKEFLQKIDIMVDGEFIEENKLVDLKFRGSTNQRKIDVQASLKNESVVQLKFGDESRYEEENKNPKVIFFKEFKEEKQENVAEETVIPAATQEENDNIISITPAFEIRETEERIAAEGIDNKDDNNL